MVKINPYLMVSNGKSAIELYKDLFGAKQVDHIPFQKEAGAYFGFPEDFDYENSTMHAELDIGGATIMLSDNPMNKNRSGNVQILVNLDSKKDLDKIYEKVKEKGFEILMDKNRSGNVQILVNLDSKKDLDKIYEKVKEKGFEILMDLQKTSWGSWFLVFEDSYGIGWQLNFPEAE
jgi:uncharacterized glyoxalase superfamily protein PhnB